MDYRYTVSLYLLLIAAINYGLSGDIAAQTVPAPRADVADPQLRQLRAKQLEFQQKIHETFKMYHTISRRVYEQDTRLRKFLEGKSTPEIIRIIEEQFISNYNTPHRIPSDLQSVHSCWRTLLSDEMIMTQIGKQIDDLQISGELNEIDRKITALEIYRPSDATLYRNEINAIDGSITRLVASWDLQAMRILGWDPQGGPAATDGAALRGEVIKIQKDRLVNSDQRNDVEFHAPEPPSNIDELRERVFVPHEIWSKYDALKIETSHAGWEEQIRKEVVVQAILDHTAEIQRLKNEIQRLQGLLPQLEAQGRQQAGRAEYLARREREQDTLEQRLKNREEELREESKRLDELQRQNEERQQPTDYTGIEDRMKQEALQKQIADFEKFCAPGMRYEGKFRYRGARAQSSPPYIVHIDFKEYEPANKNAVNGTITFVLEGADAEKVERSFTVTVNTGDVAAYPVTGEIYNIGIPLDSYENFIRTYRVPSLHRVGLASYPTAGTSFIGLVRDERHISIRFTDGKMDFFVGTAPGIVTVPLNLSAVQ